MKKTAAIIVFCICLLFSVSAYAKAEAEGYIIELNDNAPVMLMNTDDDIALIGESGRYFYAENITDLTPYLPYAKNICKNFLLELFDYPETTNDTYFEEQWNHPAMKTEALRKAGLDGSGVKIGIIDSGINIAHEDIDREKIVYTYDYISKTEEFEKVNDSVGHGSFVTGTIAAVTNNEQGIAGIAPGAELAEFRVTDGKELEVAALIDCFERAIAQGCDVINMSLGAPGRTYGSAGMEMMRSLADTAYENNIIVVAAVGNDYNSTLNYPAGYETVIGVGSVGKSLGRSAFSNYNESVFVTAPGESLKGIYSGGSSAYIKSQGTSFSTPEVSAAAAIAKQAWSNITPDEFKMLLIDTVTDLGDDGYDIRFGYGMLDFEAITETLLTQTPKPLPTPTPEPTADPTATPTATPTTEPTTEPTATPTAEPTATPTVTPTTEPTATPTIEPTAEPTATPTPEPTPEITPTPTASPEPSPTIEPTEPPLPTEPPKMSINAVFTDNEGNIITNVTQLNESEGKITANVTIDGVIKSDDTAIAANIILAVYDDSGALLGIELNAAELPEVNNEFMCGLNIPENVSVGYVKLMLWEDLIDMLPLTESRMILR